MVSATCIIDVVLFCYPGGGGGGGCSALPAPIHAVCVCPEQNHSPNLKCMLTVSYNDDNGPDRNLNILCYFSSQVNFSCFD